MPVTWHEERVAEAARRFEEAAKPWLAEIFGAYDAAGDSMLSQSECRSSRASERGRNAGTRTISGLRCGRLSAPTCRLANGTGSAVFRRCRLRWPRVRSAGGRELEAISEQALRGRSTSLRATGRWKLKVTWHKQRLQGSSSAPSARAWRSGSKNQLSRSPPPGARPAAATGAPPPPLAMVALLLVGSVVGLVLQLADSGPRWSPCPLGRAGTRQPLSDGPAGLWGALRTREESPRRAQTSRSSGGATHSQVCHPQPTLRCPPTIAGSTREAPSDGAVGGHGAGAR